jgi:hypothetical protein
MESATEKLELGMQRLAKAGEDADLLGLALQSIHGALEDHFRARLAVDPHIHAEQRAAMLDPKRVQWKDLLDAMQLYGDLSAPDRELIWRTNGMRTKVAHGGRYPGTRADLERYARLVQSLCGYTPPTSPAAPAGTKPPRAARSRAAAETTDIPRAVRAGTRAPAPRSRVGWLAVLLALVLLVGLAGFVVLRSAARPLAQAAATVISAPLAQSSTPAPSSAPPTALPQAALVMATDGLNLRRDHLRAAGVIATLPDGARVAIVGGPVDADGFVWWNVEANGRRGWCVGDFLKFEYHE